MVLPRFVVLQSNHNHKYLHCVNEDVQPFLQFTGEEVVSPYAKFQVEMGKNGKGLIHIRSCYNNKYWAKCSADNEFIAAVNKEPEEDQSKWSCTLFKPIFLDSGGGGDAKKVLRFLHVQLGHYVCLRVAPPHNSCLFAGSTEPEKDRRDVYTIIDWESLLILPKHVAFKGHNGCYLSARTIEGYPYLQFASNDRDGTVGHEIFTTHDGSIRIKSNYFGKFWRRSPNWIWADSDDTSSNNSDTLFWPIKVDNNVIALRNLGNNNFCKSLTTEGKINCLNAAVPNIANDECLQVEELIISRHIYNINFRPEDARIYNKSVVTMATEDVVNRTQQPSNEELNLSYTNTRSSTWNASVSIKLGAKLTLEEGVPLIIDGKIEFSTEINAGFQWGQTESFTNVVESVHKVIAPPMSKTKVRLVATRGSCDVPFSYTQCETLTNGDQITQIMDDGIYTGVNCFSFEYETHQENLGKTVICEIKSNLIKL